MEARGIRSIGHWRLAAPGSPELRCPAGLMGILNVTPDSFSDGGLHATVSSAIAAGALLHGDGADWLDVGGESSRPGAMPVGADEETGRILPVISGLAQFLRPMAGRRLHLSVDTCKAAVAGPAIIAGAIMVNDISAGGDPAMFGLVAEHGVALCLMHMQGTPATMQVAPRYRDVVDAVIAFLAERMRAAMAAGVAEKALLLDPGIGFGKQVEHNLQLLKALPRFGREFNRPLVVGVSRKSLIPALLGEEIAPAERDRWSHLLHVQIAPHCALLRVHDVAGARRALRLLVNDGEGHP